MVESAGTTRLSEYAFSSVSFSAGELRPINRMGASAGFTFLYDGGVSISGGSERVER